VEAPTSTPVGTYKPLERVPALFAHKIPCGLVYLRLPVK